MAGLVISKYTIALSCRQARTCPNRKTTVKAPAASRPTRMASICPRRTECCAHCKATLLNIDRKSTRLNSSHGYISYAVFCLKKKKIKRHNQHSTQHKRALVQ